MEIFELSNTCRVVTLEELKFCPITGKNPVKMFQNIHTNPMTHSCSIIYFSLGDPYV